MRISYIELLGEKHPLCFSLSATEEMCKEFGSIEAMTVAMDSDNMGEKLSAIDTILTILMKAGRRYCTAIGEDMPQPLKCRPADIISIDDAKIISGIKQAMLDDTDRTVEVQEKNAEATRG